MPRKKKPKRPTPQFCKECGYPLRQNSGVKVCGFCREEGEQGVPREGGNRDNPSAIARLRGLG